MHKDLLCRGEVARVVGDSAVSLSRDRGVYAGSMAELIDDEIVVAALLDLVIGIVARSITSGELSEVEQYATIAGILSEDLVPVRDSCTAVALYLSDLEECFVALEAVRRVLSQVNSLVEELRSLSVALIADSFTSDTHSRRDRRLDIEEVATGTYRSIAIAACTLEERKDILQEGLILLC